MTVLFAVWASSAAVIANLSPDNEQGKSCASDQFKHRDIRIHWSTPFSRGRRRSVITQ
jgi:hypothetical protein